jgi:hypothetical protein
VSARSGRTVVARLRTPVALSVVPDDAFEPVGEVWIGIASMPRTAYAGPGGIWEVLLDTDGAPLPQEVVRGYLAGDPVRERGSFALAQAFGGTPVGAYGDWDGRNGCGCRIDFRGHETEGPVPDGGEGGAILRDWLEREVAFVGDRAVRRWRPVASLRPRYDRSWSWTDLRRDIALDVLAATPHTWESLMTFSRAYEEMAGAGRVAGWMALARHWPKGGNEDLLYLLNTHGERLLRRVEARWNAIRARDPDHRDRVELERLLMGALQGLARRAALGLAGSPGHETDLDAFRKAVSLEAGLAGKHGYRTGIDDLQRYLVEVVGARRLSLPEGDGDALGALAPGRRP